MTNRKLFNSKGSSTLELTIIFPVVFLLLLAVIFFVLFIYRKLAVMDTAVYAAKVSAATWSNSQKNLENGSIRGNYKGDGLYWRISNDYDGSLLVKKKVGKAQSFAHQSLLESLLGEKDTGAIVSGYNRGLVKRAVFTKIERGIVSAAAAADINEPPEFIRVYLLGKEYSLELIRYLKTFGQASALPGKIRVIASRKSNVYGQKLYHFPGCRHIAKIKQENVIEFRSEDEAAKGGFNLCLDCAKTLFRGQGK